MANQLKEELILSTQHFDKKIDDVIKQVNKLKAQGSKIGDGFNGSMDKMIQKATGFNGSMGSLIGVVGKFSGALGIAMSAGELFNRMMSESQTIGDAVAKVQNQASEAVNYFASSMASADFGGFLDGLRNIISLAGDAADAMDRAASIATRFGWTNKSQVASYNKAMAEARNPENSKEDRLKYLNEAKEISKQIAKNENLKSQADIDAAFKTIRTELAKVKYNGKSVDVNRLTNDDIRKLFDVSNFAQNEQIHDNMKQALDGVVLTNTKYGAHGAHLAKRDQEKFSTNNRMLAAYAANEINDDADSQLANALQMIGAVDELLANQAERQAQIGKLTERITKSTDKVNTRITKTTRGGGSSKPQYAVGSVGYWEQVISDLQQKVKLQVDSSEIAKLNKELSHARAQLSELLRPTKKLDLDLSKMKPNFGSATNITTELNKFLERKPLDVSIDKKSFKEQFDEAADKVGQVTDSFFSFDNVISDIESLSIAIGEGANAWQIFMGVLQTGMGILQTVGSVIQTLTTLQEIFGATSTATAAQSAAASETEAAAATTNTAAKSGEAIASATASGAKMPFPLNIVAIAAGVAAVIAALGMITGAFADGGIVGGNSYGGDRLLARVNSGEAIINTNQQKHLFELLNNGTTDSASGGNVHFVIRGKDLHGVLNNYSDKMNKVR